MACQATSYQLIPVGIKFTDDTSEMQRRFILEKDGRYGQLLIHFIFSTRFWQLFSRYKMLSSIHCNSFKETNYALFQESDAVPWDLGKITVAWFGQNTTEKQYNCSFFSHVFTPLFRTLGFIGRSQTHDSKPAFFSPGCASFAIGRSVLVDMPFSSDTNRARVQFSSLVISQIHFRGCDSVRASLRHQFCS